MSMTGFELKEVLRAIRFASEAHRDHRRKGETAAPYINHPIAVAEQLAAAGLADDPELLMAAVLHDVIEDTDTTPADMEKAFGPRVTGIVLEVSDDKALAPETRKLKVVEGIAKKSREARLVKLSDLIANFHDVIHHPPNWDVPRKRGYLEWGRAVVNNLRGTHEGLEGRFNQLAESLEQEVSGLEA